MTKGVELYYADFEIMAVAVREWWRHYGVDPDDRTATYQVYVAAIRLYCAGHRSASDLSSLLIAEINGSTDARNSSALH